MSFQPKGPGGRSATGITDSQGRYRLSTFARGDGAPSGTYQVIVFKFKETPVAEGGAYRPPQGPEPPPQHELPAKYAVAATSGIEATVGNGPLDFNIELSP